MKVGKLTIEDLKNLIFNNLKNTNENIISSGEIGNDCSAVKIDDKILYLSSDPITGTSKEIGKLAININCNDIATEGVSPVGIMLTILAPPNTSKEDISFIMKQAQEEADKIGVTIMGGHTEITNAVNKIIISATSIGIGDKKDFKNKTSVIPGDKIIITKGVGIEGIGILAFEKESELSKRFDSNLINEAKNLLNFTSVVKDGIIANKYAKGMHDVTEGGLLGALWESSCFYNLGISIDYSKIPISNVVKNISNFFNIDPLRLISSGTMLIVCSPDNENALINDLKRNRIDSFSIGEFTSSKEKVLIKNNEKILIDQPESDELYKVI